jgi:hypothetical protein
MEKLRSSSRVLRAKGRRCSVGVVAVGDADLLGGHTDGAHEVALGRRRREQRPIQVAGTACTLRGAGKQGIRVSE